MRQLIRLSGDTMDRGNPTNLGLGTLQGPSLPQLPEGLESAFNRGHTLSIEGTNVVRVPFGVREARRTRPERPDHWATLVIPLQPIGTPTPPPAAACTQAALISVLSFDSLQSSRAFTSANEQDGVRKGSNRSGLRSGRTSHPLWVCSSRRNPR